MNKLIGESDQRFGQLIMNAIAEYLMSNGRPYDDEEVAKCLFYVSDEQLNSIVDWYVTLDKARGAL